MKVCHRCGNQGGGFLVELEVYENTNHTGSIYRQGFVLCTDCKDVLFDRLSVVLSDSRKWVKPEEPEDSES